MPSATGLTTTDDTPPIQAAINAAPVGGAIFIPNTGHSCNILGAFAALTTPNISRTAGTPGTVTATFSSIPAQFDPITVGSTLVFPPLAIWGVARGSNLTNFNGVFVPFCVAPTFGTGCSTGQIKWNQGGGLDSATGGSASIGLWTTQDNLKFFGQSVGAVNSFEGSSLSTSNPIYILTFAGSNGPDVESLAF